MRVRAVPKGRIREIVNEDWIDRTRRLFIEGDIAWVPVRNEDVCDCEISPRSLYQGKGFFMIGDVAVIHGEKPSRNDVDEIVGFRRPRGVLWIESLHEVTRIPRTQVLWGDTGEVQHRENGYTYILDPRKVMFAQGNRNEKMRIAQLVLGSETAERVADMFAGIGYFTIPMAGSGARVHAMEINPVAFDYLNRNVHVNGLSSRINSSLGDCRDLLTGIYDRIVMGHFNAITMLPSALLHVRDGSIIHLHSIGTVEDQIKEQVEGAGFSASIHVHKVKKYRPHTLHIVQDVTIL
ncbi:MAG: SAM-dependent methyltransferase [Methanoregula sp.]|jgi:tRNA wybutosine-synthesizing protein 2|nr:SAM-dependent methyltransferase [Methanoregula sp.]